MPPGAPAESSPAPGFALRESSRIVLLTDRFLRIKEELFSRPLSVNALWLKTIGKALGVLGPKRRQTEINPQPRVPSATRNCLADSTGPLLASNAYTIIKPRGPVVRKSKPTSHSALSRTMDASQTGSFCLSQQSARCT